MRRKPKYLGAEVKERRKRDKVRAFYCGARWTPRQVAAFAERKAQSDFATIPLLKDPFGADKRLKSFMDEYLRWTTNKTLD